MITTCAECGGKVSDKAEACPHCGAPVRTDGRRKPCADCGEPLPARAAKCPSCGAPTPSRGPKPSPRNWKTIALVIALCVVGVLVVARSAREPAAPMLPSSSACPEGMVAIPGGTFQMGLNSGEADEMPLHAVTVGAFCMDVTEVTVDAYAACVRGGGCNTSGLQGSWVNLCNWGQGDKGNHPINCVDWAQASAYCQWAGKRLPTEQDWQFAAQGPDGRTYPWGNHEPGGQLCWARRDGTCPAASYPSGDSPFGLKDMAGNVGEWTSSSYDAKERVVRGGFWSLSDALYVRAASRGATNPTVQYDIVGFRCAR